jgi:GNAT superfamily N-acetyltransferase
MNLPAGFLELPPLVYASDPIAPREDPRAVAGAFSEHNPWFQRGEAVAFCEAGRARAAAFRERGLVIDGQPAAFFGYFESTGDAAGEAAILAQVEDWARAHGAKVLYGPIQFATALGYRFLLSAEPGALPFAGEPYNPAAYPSAMERSGFALHQRYLTQVIGRDTARISLERGRPALPAAREAGFRFEALDGAIWQRRERDLFALVDHIFGANFAYTPIPFPVFSAIGHKIAATLCPHTSVIAYGPENDIAGVGIAFPHDRQPRGCILKTFGTNPAHRGKGIFTAILIEMLDRGWDRYDTWYGALIREDNASRRFFKDDIDSARWYGLYSRPL